LEADLMSGRKELEEWVPEARPTTLWGKVCAWLG
jgi:hypothetical protein